MKRFPKMLSNRTQKCKGSRKVRLWDTGWHDTRKLLFLWNNRVLHQYLWIMNDLLSHYLFYIYISQRNQPSILQNLLCMVRFAKFIQPKYQKVRTELWKPQKGKQLQLSNHLWSIYVKNMILCKIFELSALAGSHLFLFFFFCSISGCLIITFPLRTKTEKKHMFRFVMTMPEQRYVHETYSNHLQ